jgi:NitT/TauT family transport system substrate-binding protein
MKRPAAQDMSSQRGELREVALKTVFVRAFAIGSTILALVVGISSASVAETISPIIIGYTASTDSLGLFVAAEQGFFKKHNLDAKLQLIALNSVLPSALQSDSVQIAGPSVSVVLQAVENGLDLVAISGGASTSQDATNYAVVSSVASGIKSPEDMAGKKVGVPGLGATLHILGREWLQSHGVDYRKVKFIEVPFTQMNDVLKAGTVDAVISADPITTRMLSSGTGHLVSYFLSEVPAGLPTSLYAMTRTYAESHRDVVREFRAALSDAASFAAAHPDDTRQAVGKYIKFPADILAKTYLPKIVVPLSKERIAWWIEVMTKQEMIRTPPSPEKLLAPE